MISTDITSTRFDRTIDRAADRGASVQAAVCTDMRIAQNKSADVRITAELRASSFAEGHVWLRPTTLDVLVPTTPGHLAWSPPT